MDFSDAYAKEGKIKVPIYVGIGREVIGGFAEGKYRFMELNGEYEFNMDIDQISTCHPDRDIAMNALKVIFAFSPEYEKIIWERACRKFMTEEYKR